MKNILFICSANVDRSKTAESFYAEKIPSLNFKSAGTNHELCHKASSTHLNQKDLDWADMTLVMEPKHLNWMQSNLFVEKKVIEVLNIEDNYTYYSKELIEMLQQVCPRFF